MNIQPEQFQKILERRLIAKDITGKDHNYVCPFCLRDDSEGTLHINYLKGAARCHQCWFGTRSLTHLVRDIFGYLPKRIMRLLERPQLMVDIEKLLTDTEEEQQSVELPKSFRRLGERNTGVGDIVWRYLTRVRGFTFEDVDRWGLGYLTDKKHPAFGYAIFPFYVGGRCVYWQGRRVVGRGPKAYNPPNTGKRALLYGYEQAIGQRTVRLVEGPSDAIAFGAGGMGLTSLDLHEEQIKVLSRLEPERILVCLDATEHERTKMYAMELQRRTSSMCGYLLLNKGDPDSNRHRLHRLEKRRAVWIGNNHTASVVQNILDMPLDEWRKLKRAGKLNRLTGSKS